jgi:hypothetical protein
MKKPRYITSVKFILNFKELFESTSAFSQERAGWEYPPFKFAKNFDPRIGYSKDDFCIDLTQIYTESDNKKRQELMEVVSKNAGVFRIRDIKRLQNDIVNKLMKDIESFLESKADKKLTILPDGFILCYEDMKNDTHLCDIYYSPFQKIIKISYTNMYPEDKDLVIKLEEFKPEDFKIEKNDFKNTIDKCDGAASKKDDSFVI